MKVFKKVYSSAIISIIISLSLIVAYVLEKFGKTILVFTFIDPSRFICSILPFDEIKFSYEPMALHFCYAVNNEHLIPVHQSEFPSHS